MLIEIVGMSSSATDNAYDNAAEAVKRAGVAADIVRIEDMPEVVKRGIMMPPGVFIDGALKMSGKVPSADDFAAWLK